MKIAIFSASLGNMDQVEAHVPQSIPYDYFLYTDENMPPRFNSMTPRLQAKIPKFFPWQLHPGYDYYMWIDGNLTMTNPDSLKWFLEQCQDSDIVVLNHPRRNTVKLEADFIAGRLKRGCSYITPRYENELLQEQMNEINADKDFVDDALYCGGVFIYKNTTETQKMMKDWWHHSSRYFIMDQLAFPYLLKKHNLKVNARPEVYFKNPYIKHKNHVKKI